MHEGPGLDAEAEEFRAQVCAWLTERLAPEQVAGRTDPTDRTGLAESFERELQADAGRRGWLGISVPAELGGGGRSAAFAAAFQYEVAYHDAPLVDTALVLAGAPVMAFARPDQRDRLLPPMLRGEVELCVAYTEPGAGNDLAALSSIAWPGPDGGYLLSGHKTLIAGAGKADLCLTVARTDPSAPVRRGISMLMVAMDSPGVSVIPRRTMAGYDLFDVVFDQVTLPAEALLGKAGEGWRQLAYAAERERTGLFYLGWCQRLFDEVHQLCAGGGAEPRLLDDPVVADGLAGLWVGLREARWAALRLVAEETAGVRSAVSASRAKVVLTEYATRLTQFATETAGPAASIDPALFGSSDPAALAGGRFGFEYLSRFDGPVGAGANEVHRSGIAALALGLRPARTW